MTGVQTCALPIYQGGDGAKGKGKVQMVEIEEEWMGEKLKALTCYFGGLPRGQEHLF